MNDKKKAREGGRENSCLLQLYTQVKHFNIHLPNQNNQQHFQKWHSAVRNQEGKHTGLKVLHPLYPWVGRGALGVMVCKKSSNEKSPHPVMRPFFLSHLWFCHGHFNGETEIGGYWRREICWQLSKQCPMPMPYYGHWARQLCTRHGFANDIPKKTLLGITKDKQL